MARLIQGFSIHHLRPTLQRILSQIPHRIHIQPFFTSDSFSPRYSNHPPHQPRQPSHVEHALRHAGTRDYLREQRLLVDELNTLLESCDSEGWKDASPKTHGKKTWQLWLMMDDGWWLMDDGWWGWWRMAICFREDKTATQTWILQQKSEGTRENNFCQGFSSSFKRGPFSRNTPHPPQKKHTQEVAGLIKGLSNHHDPFLMIP